MERDGVGEFSDSSPPPIPSSPALVPGFACRVWLGSGWVFSWPLSLSGFGTWGSLPCFLIYRADSSVGFLAGGAGGALQKLHPGIQPKHVPNANHRLWYYYKILSCRAIHQGEPEDGECRRSLRKCTPWWPETSAGLLLLRFWLWVSGGPRCGWPEGNEAGQTKRKAGEERHQMGGWEDLSVSGAHMWGWEPTFDPPTPWFQGLYSAFFKMPRQILSRDCHNRKRQWISLG